MTGTDARRSCPTPSQPRDDQLLAPLADVGTQLGASSNHPRARRRAAAKQARVNQLTPNADRVGRASLPVGLATVPSAMLPR
jgi:hypothetical protein